MEKKMKYLILGMVGIFTLVLGATLAWYTWTSTNTDVTLTIGGVTITYDAGEDITGKNLRPVLDKEVGVEKNYAIKKDITVSSNKNTYFNLYLKTEIFDEGLKHETLKWELYEGNVMLNTGNFGNITQGDTITLVENLLINNIDKLLTLYIYIDGNVDNPEQMQNNQYKFVLNATATDEVPVLTRTSEQMIEHLGLTSLVKTGNPDFESIATTDEGIYTAEDDLGKSYYFRGASENNYVYFAGYYWRIVRINGDGTIRMIYDGSTKHKNEESSEDRQLQTTAYNAREENFYNDNTGVGYMFGAKNQGTYEATHANINSSTVKRVVDTWYRDNIDNTEYEQYVADAIYCNDRKVGSEGDGIGETRTYYEAKERLQTDYVSPSLKCSQKNDRFTQSVELGNGALASTYPIGLITADEIVFAGGNYGGSNSNNQYYLYTGYAYWTMSPAGFGFDYGGNSRIYFVYSNGSLSTIYAESYPNQTARPIISLKSDISFEGNGSYETPFYLSGN